jgi:hypothetical protein
LEAISNQNALNVVATLNAEDLETSIQW